MRAISSPVLSVSLNSASGQGIVPSAPFSVAVSLMLSYCSCVSLLLTLSLTLVTLVLVSLSFCCAYSSCFIYFMNVGRVFFSVFVQVYV